ncbi:hypothetical protein BDV95DRAFT_611163 [Massariosphaeria phaeospora]|uniref:XPG-I domain-containing protein n=1 Tax=Massariosphaeria phaeospora TaxID=100035 RepID=A0A7C8I8A9_9PLEO|nr:hypothetical protein BDV95DRAFT_611163 [Massariosphaeria phaeospora]
MGIHGIYKEIGPGKRVALSKLAVDKFEETGRSFRIAIDVSIWLFQMQASEGGTNPALRTFYYRLLRLISLSIHPVFVFDGPNKPPFKRNKRTGANVASIPDFLVKQLLKQFGFPIHRAPGEAEAECALLQREGIVDAVLSEDVDTLMFGSGLTIRKWSPELKSSSKTPTHVTVYDAVETKNGPSGLDREGMILIALMSGGDYVPEGIPGCGPKTACEAARAGFGADLCKIAKNDARGMLEWRTRLQHELKTNDSKFFKTKHKALKIPDNFPRTDILGYYTHPAISNSAGLDKLRSSINWDQDLDFPGLRSFAQDAFDWCRLEGAKHFIRSLAPSLLVRHLRLRGEQVHRFPTNNLLAVQEDEALLVKGIHSRRQHATTDSTPELRVSFIPIELVKLDLSIEEPDIELETEDPPPPVTQAGDGDQDEEITIEDEDVGESGPKKRGPTKFDPNAPIRHWVLETYVKVGVPLKVQDWEAGLSKPRRAATAREPRKAAPKGKGAKRAKTTGDAPQTSIERFAKVTKPGVKAAQALAKAQNVPAKPPAAPVPTLAPQRDVINLLSSSPVKPSSNTTTQPAREPSLSPVLELPSSVTKRRKRAPMQRSKTLPAVSNTMLDRPGTPPLLDTIEMLDLAGSLTLPSPSQLPAKKAKTRTARMLGTQCPPSAASTATSPVKSKQATLDAWRMITPTRPRARTPPADDRAVHNSPELKSSRLEDVETWDLTLSSPLAAPEAPPLLLPTNPRRTTAAASSKFRPPLHSISSNASQLSSTSASTLFSASTASSKPISKSRSKAAPAPPTRRSSPRLRKAKSASPEIASLDLTGLSSPPPSPTTTSKISAAAPPPAPTHPLTLPSPPAPPRKPASPPAAWKSHKTKKRDIILRQSLAGAWAFVDAESPGKDSSTAGGAQAAAAVVPKGKERRRWRESEIEVLDLSLSPV